MSIYAQGGSVAIADTSGLQAIPTRILTVSAAGQGGQFATIALAIAAAEALVPAADNLVDILLYPGIYAEETLELPDYVSLIGVDRQTCVLQKASTYYDTSTSISTALLFLPYNHRVANLTIRNTRSNAAPGYGVAVAVGAVVDSGGGFSGSTAGDYYCRISNCTIDTPNTSFSLHQFGNTYQTIEDCEITGFRFPWVQWTRSRAKVSRRTYAKSTQTSAGDECPLWINGAGVTYFDQCRFHATGVAANNGGVYIDDEGTDGGIWSFNGCWFSNGATEYTPGQLVGDIKVDATACTVKINNCVYSDTKVDAKITYTTEDMGDRNKSFGGTCAFDVLSTSGGATLDGGLVVNSGAAAVDVTIKSDTNASLVHVDGTNNTVGIGAASPGVTGAALAVTVGGTVVSGYAIDAIRSVDTAFGPMIRFFKRRTTGNGQSNDVCGGVLAYAENDAGEDTVVGEFNFTEVDASDGVEDGDFIIKLMLNGAARAEKFRIKSTGVMYLAPVSAAPSGSEGMFYTNSTDHKLYYHNGTDWQEVAFV